MRNYLLFLSCLSYFHYARHKNCLQYPDSKRWTIILQFKIYTVNISLHSETKTFSNVLEPKLMARKLLFSPHFLNFNLFQVTHCQRNNINGAIIELNYITHNGQIKSENADNPLRQGKLIKKI